MNGDSVCFVYYRPSLTSRRNECVGEFNDNDDDNDRNDIIIMSGITEESLLATEGKKIVKQTHRVAIKWKLVRIVQMYAFSWVYLDRILMRINSLKNY